jgi:hypothetical protein
MTTITIYYLPQHYITSGLPHPRLTITPEEFIQVSCVASHLTRRRLCLSCLHLTCTGRMSGYLPVLRWADQELILLNFRTISRPATGRLARSGLLHECLGCRAGNRVRAVVCHLGGRLVVRVVRHAPIGLILSFRSRSGSQCPGHCVALPMLRLRLRSLLFFLGTLLILLRTQRTQHSLMHVTPTALLRVCTILRKRVRTLTPWSAQSRTWEKIQSCNIPSSQKKMLAPTSAPQGRLQSLPCILMCLYYKPPLTALCRL